jgi:hypothetical protein
MLSVAHAECHKKALYAECRYAECRYAQCRYAKCRGGGQNVFIVKATVFHILALSSLEEL